MNSAFSRKVNRQGQSKQTIQGPVCVIWAALTIANMLYIASPANFGRLLDPENHSFRMSVNRNPVSIIFMLVDH